MKLRLLELQKQKMLFMAKQAENRVNSVDVASLKRGIDSSQELKQAMETLGSRISLLEEKLLRLESEVDTVAQKSEERQRIPHRVPNHEATRKADEQFVTEVIGVPLTFSWSKRRETQETIPTVVEPEREAVEPDAAEQSIRTCAKVPDSADEDLQARYGKTYDRMHAIFEQQREALRARQCQLTARLSPSAHSSEDLEARRLKQYNESVAVFQKEQADLRELKRQQNVYMAQMRVLREKKEKEQATTSTMPSVQDYAETWLKKSRYGEGLTAERAQPITSMSELESFEKRNTSQQDKSIKHPLLHDTTYREHPGNVRETILRSVLFSDAMTALFENQLFRSFRSHPDRRADIARMVAETIIVRGEGYVLVKMEDMEKYKAKLMQIADAWPVDSTRSSWKALEERV